jgi:uncharacterized membrane protein HdeD (DUF308 family)
MTAFAAWQRRDRMWARVQIGCAVVLAILAFLHEVVARHLAHDAAELLLLLGLALFAVARGIANHCAYACVDHPVIRGIAMHPHIAICSYSAQFKILH